MSQKRRTYYDACGTAHALELVGERWALLIMRELMLGPRRFGELRADLPGLSANVLTQRLTELEEKGLVVRRKLPPPASVQVYELTPWGYEADPIIRNLGAWAARSPLHDPMAPISGVSVMMSMKTLFVPGRGAGWDETIGFRFGEDEYVGHVTPAGFAPRRGEATACRLWFEGTPNGFTAFNYGGVPAETLAQQGLLTIHGDTALADRLRGLFQLPEKVGV